MSRTGCPLRQVKSVIVAISGTRFAKLLSGCTKRFQRKYVFTFFVFLQGKYYRFENFNAVPSFRIVPQTNSQLDPRAYAAPMGLSVVL